MVKYVSMLWSTTHFQKHVLILTVATPLKQADDYKIFTGYELHQRCLLCCMYVCFLCLKVADGKRKKSLPYLAFLFSEAFVLFSFMC